jgi:hypothetical protein
VALESSSPFSFLHRENEYRLAFYAKGDARLRISVRSPEQELVSAAVRVQSAGWQRQPLALSIRGKVAAGTPLVFRIELAEPGEVWLDQITLFPADNIEGTRHRSEAPRIKLLTAFLRELRVESLGGRHRSAEAATRRNPPGDFEPNHGH